MKQFTEAFNRRNFQCFPKISRDQQPWNGADTYLYNHLLREELLFPGARVLILNDDTGLLTYLLREYSPTVTSDSIFAKTAIEENFKTNCEDPSQFTFIDSVSFIENSHENFDIVLIKLPKSNSYLSNQISVLKNCTSADSQILTSGMVKHISKNISEILKKEIGETLIHRVEKKAILFSSKNESGKTEVERTSSFNIHNLGEFVTYSNTFSAGKLDKGTAALLPQIPKDLSGRVADLGCGYGVISRHLKQNCPDISELIAVDASRMAVESTKLNVEGINALWCDGLSDFDDDSLDAVVSNPPFHQDTSFSVNMGLRLFRQVETS